MSENGRFIRGSGAYYSCELDHNECYVALLDHEWKIVRKRAIRAELRMTK